MQRVHIRENISRVSVLQSPSPTGEGRKDLAFLVCGQLRFTRRGQSFGTTIRQIPGDGKRVRLERCRELREMAGRRAVPCVVELIRGLLPVRRIRCRVGCAPPSDLTGSLLSVDR
jgi:hypothetical protein